MEKKSSRSKSTPIIPSKPGDGAPNNTLPPELQMQNANGVSPVRLDRMMESLRYAEYNIESGVGELLDNSVESGAQSIWVFVEQEPKQFTTKTVNVVGSVATVDNGVGMSPDVLARCLVLGESLRPMKSNGRRGIGRFGVGMTLGGISLGRRLEVYSRETKEGPFFHTYIDLDEIGHGEQKVIPTPTPKRPPAKYAELIKGSSGTVVFITNCDRLQKDQTEQEKGIAASEQIKGLATFIGRTYRKFIGPRRFFLDGKEVYLHDPLYVASPTRFEVGGKQELKAKVVGSDIIELEVPGQPGKMAQVTITMSMLPKEWRVARGAGGSTFAKEHKIDENEGISILRADREVLYGAVPYILGSKGQAATLDIDRWWGCEIGFPPELDDYFHVRYIKRGAEPVKSLKDQIRAKIFPVVTTLRQQIKRDFDDAEAAKLQNNGVFSAAEDDMSAASAKLPRSVRGSDTPPDVQEAALDRLIDEDVRSQASSPADKEKKKEDLKKKEFALLPVRFPKQVLFETEHLLGLTVVKLNIAHPFYKQVFEPLCGSVETLTEDSDPNEGAKTDAEKAARHGFQLLLMSYAKAEGMMLGKATDDDLETIRSQWGIVLATAVSNMEAKKA
ncbi:ATP-binding protein [Corallococcus sp. M7]